MSDTVIHTTDTTDLHIPHDVFRSVFAGIPEIVAGVPTDDTARVAAVTTYADNVLRFLDAHHDGEDVVIWPRLSARCPAQHELIERMVAEHEAVDALRAAAGDALLAWSRSPGTETAMRLGDAMTALHSSLDDHFAAEEREVVPLASANLSPEEWGQLPAHAMQHFTGDKIWLVLGLVINQMSDEERAAILPHMPPPVLEMWNSTGRPAYEALLAEVRGIH